METEGLGGRLLSRGSQEDKIPENKDDARSKSKMFPMEVCELHELCF